MTALVLNGPFIPKHSENRMANEGDVAGARERFLKTRFRNLDALLKQRFGWMNEHLKPGDVIVEFGCGAGFSKLYINHPGLMLTDVLPSPWAEKYADAMDPPFEPESVDVIICSHMIHHMAKPVAFFDKVRSILKPGGRIIIQDLNTSLMMRAMLKAMRHEGWSYKIDVFNANEVTNDPDDPWSANCAIPELLFKSSREFESRVPGYTVKVNKLNEAFLFPASGGVIAKAKVPELPGFMLGMIKGIDAALVALMPGIFACGRSVVLEKTA